MAKTLYQFRVYCETEAAYVTGWYEEDPHRCPNNAAHTITESRTAIVDKVATEFPTNAKTGDPQVTSRA